MIIHSRFLLQTLTTFKLSYNEIGQQGGERFANALEENKVTGHALLYSLSNCSVTILTDTHHTWPPVFSNQWRCTISYRENTWNQCAVESIWMYAWKMKSNYRNVFSIDEIIGTLIFNKFDLCS